LPGGDKRRSIGRRDPAWIGWIEELPGANTQGSTLEEARENLKEAARLVLDANRQLAVDHSVKGAVVKEELLVSV
jgi:predicted RNase H-like HicB family nuclease